MAASSRQALLENLRDACALDLDVPPEADHWTDAELTLYFQSGGYLKPTPREVVAEPATPVKVSYNPKTVPPAAPAATLKTWFPRLKKRDAPSLRVVCFAPAGCAENVFTGSAMGIKPPRPSLLMAWADQNNAEVYAVELPGRMQRRLEPYLNTCPEVARTVFGVVGSLLAETNVPYVVMGHSVGTWNSFEFVSLLRDEGYPPPLRLILSNFPSPDIPMEARPWKVNRDLAVSKFKTECRGWDVNEVVFSEALWPTYHGVLRADFTLFDEYTFDRAGEAPLDAPMTLLFGTTDKRISKEHVEGWLRFTSKGGDVHRIQGNHLFVYDVNGKKQWLEIVTAALDKTLEAHHAEASSGEGGLLEDAVQRWAFNTGDWNPSPAEWDFALSLLPEHEQKACTRFHFEKDRKLAMGSRLLQRKLVEEQLGIPFAEVCIERTHEGKPFLANRGAQREAMKRFPNWNYNATHHGSIVAIAAEPICLVGLDVMDELDRPRSCKGPTDFFASFTGNFTKREWKHIKKGSDDEQFANFYRNWAAKEAYIKAVGIGLGFDLQRAEYTFEGARVHVSIDGRPQDLWDLRNEHVGKHVLVVARGPPREAMDGYRDNLPGAHITDDVIIQGLALPSKPFSMVTFPDLIPSARRKDFEAL